MDLTITSSKNKWIENFARCGYAAKGVVYCLVGILAFIAAFGAGSSSNTEKRDAFNLILEQPFGKFLLGIVALGLLGYVAWRLIEAIKDPENRGKDAKGVFIRIGYAISAMVYLSLSIYAFKLVLGNGGGSSGNSAKQDILSKALSSSFGQWVVGLAAILLIGIGIYQIYKAVSGKYRKDLEEARIDHKYRDILIKAGGIGYTARGLVWGVVGFLFLKAAINSNPGEAGDTSNALSFLEGFGQWVLGGVAIGLICYGVFKILEAIYKRI